PNRSYRLLLQGAGGSGGGPSFAVNFSTLSDLTGPVVTAPAANAAVANPPTIAWQAVTGATGYNLRIDDLTAGVSYAVWQPGLTGTSFTVTTLTPNRSYRASLQAVDAYGGGPWMAANFSVASPLTAPVITAPIGAVANPP